MQFLSETCLLCQRHNVCTWQQQLVLVCGEVRWLPTGRAGSDLLTISSKVMLKSWLCTNLMLSDGITGEFCLNCKKLDFWQQLTSYCEVMQGLGLPAYNVYRQCCNSESHHRNGKADTGHSVNFKRSLLKCLYYSWSIVSQILARGSYHGLGAEMSRHRYQLWYLHVRGEGRGFPEKNMEMGIEKFMGITFDIFKNCIFLMWYHFMQLCF